MTFKKSHENLIIISYQIFLVLLALLFDISFLMLCRIAQMYGIEVPYHQQLCRKVELGRWPICRNQFQVDDWLRWNAPIWWKRLATFQFQLLRSKWARNFYRRVNARAQLTKYPGGTSIIDSFISSSLWVDLNCSLDFWRSRCREFSKYWRRLVQHVELTLQFVYCSFQASILHELNFPCLRD